MRIAESFWRILFYITIFGILAAVIRKCPQTSLMVALIVEQFVPSLACCGFFAYLCRNRERALLLMAGVAFLGWLLCPTIESIRECQSWYDDFADNCQILAIYSG
ncbi:MAG: hypothetical protein WCL29_09240, partial [Pseudomonadota bacterium]